MIRSASLALSLAAITGSVPAQCSTLTITGTGAPGTTLTAHLDGSSAHALAVLVVGSTQGVTPIDLGPLGTLTLGVEPQFFVPLGLTNAAGDLSRSTSVPDVVPDVPGLDLFGQAATLSCTLTSVPSIIWTLCASNVVGFHFGN